MKKPVSITTPAQRKALRAAWIHGDASAANYRRMGGAFRRVMVRLVKHGWLDKEGSWALTDKGREIARRELGMHPAAGDALRLHLADHGQDLIYMDVHVTRLPYAKIIACAQFSIWGKYEVTNGHCNPLKFRAGQFLRLERRAEYRGTIDANNYFDLRYPIERVEFVGEGATLAAEYARNWTKMMKSREAAA